MTIYITVYSLILFFAINKKAKNIKELEKILIIILGVFLCFGYMTGSDWRGYELMYESIQLSNMFDYVKGFEVGYAIIQIMFKSLGFNFWSFFIIIKIICFLITINALKKYSNKNYTWGLLLFYGVFALDAYIDNPMRNLIASVIFILSYKYLLTNNPFKYIFLLLIASTFHMSSLLLLPVYFIRNVNLNRKTIIFTLITLFLIVLINQWQFREFLLNTIWSSSNLFSERFGSVFLHESFYEDNSNIITLGFLFHYCAFILILFKKEEIERQKYGRLIFNLSFLYIIVYTISFSIWIFFRMRLFLFVPFCICLSYLPYLYKKNISKIITIAIIVIISFFTMHSTITGSYKYIPYTNYLTYLFKEKPTYYERYYYNYKNSPYSE